MELCTAHGLAVANTFLSQSLEHQPTYYNIGAHPGGDINPQSFAQLDLVLVPATSLQKVTRLVAYRWEGLASHHFLVEIALDTQVEKQPEQRRQQVQKWRASALGNEAVQHKFAAAAAKYLKQVGGLPLDQGLDLPSRIFAEALRHAAGLTLPLVSNSARRP